MNPKLYLDKNKLDLKLVIALNRSTNNLNRRAVAIFRKHDLTQTQFAVLEVLYHKGDLKIGDIIDKILTTSGNMTVVISNLIKEGMVTKIQDPNDNRVSIISLTPIGKQKMEEVFPQYVDDLFNNMTSLSNDEKLELCNLLRKLC